jgi:hypothetical protein
MRRPWIIAASLAVVAAAVIVMMLIDASDEARRGRMVSDDVSHGMNTLTPEQVSDLQRIATLGYVSGSEPVPDATGVVNYTPDLAFRGLTLYSCSEGSAAILIDMDGRIIHSWHCPGFTSWARVHLYENGDLLVITEDYPHLMKIDRDSAILWEWNRAAHHDLDVLDDGTIAVLASEEATRPYILDGEPFLTDSVVLLRPDGTPTVRIPLLDAFERSERYSTWLLEHIDTDSSDPIHANSVEILFRNGRRFALVSMRNMDTIAVFDLAACEVVWAVTGPWHRQHEARLVPGAVLLFDNLGLDDRSRVLEYDTEADEIVWSYTEPGFFTESEGAQQRLPNGNTLITESENGRLIEVTRAGEIVWEYINPASGDLDGSEVILGISRAERLPPDFPIGWATGGRHEEATFERQADR